MHKKLFLILTPILVVAALGILYYLRIHKDKESAAAPQWEVVSESGVQAATEPPEGIAPREESPDAPGAASDDALPSEEIDDRVLDDAELLEAARALTENPLLGLLLAQSNPLKRLVKTLDALGNGRLPAISKELLGGWTNFEARKDAQGRLTATPETYSRLTPLVDAVTQVSPEKAAKWLRLAEPRLQEIIRELGYQDMTTRELLTNAMTTVLQVPIFDFYPELVPTGKSGIYEYKDPLFQELNDAQKALVRLGPENCQRIRQFAQAIAKELQLYDLNP